jgi:hypothetical protein
VRPRPDGATIASTVDLYIRLLPSLTNKRGRPYMPRTIGASAEHLRTWARWCGERSISELSEALITGYLAELRGAGLAALCDRCRHWPRGSGILGGDESAPAVRLQPYGCLAQRTSGRIWPDFRSFQFVGPGRWRGVRARGSGRGDAINRPPAGDDGTGLMVC